MKETTRDMMKAGTRIGALAGIGAFAILGLLPAMYVSSFGTVAALAAIFGPLGTGLAIRAIIVIGTVAGVCLAGAMSAAVGAIAGNALGYVADALSTKGKEAAHTATK